jgi:hypothetical protein
MHWKYNQRYFNVSVQTVQMLANLCVADTETRCVHSSPLMKCHLIRKETQRLLAALLENLSLAEYVTVWRLFILTYILRSCLSSPTFNQQGLEYFTVDPSLTKVTSLLQVTRSGFYCPGSRNSLSWGASGLDTGTWCRLHLWRHRVASPRDVKGRYPAAHNHHVHRTSELPAWTSDHRHHFKVGISIL